MADDRISIHVRMEPAAVGQLEALATKLHLNRSAVLHLAVARLAELEHIDGAPARPA